MLAVEYAFSRAVIIFSMLFIGASLPKSGRKLRPRLFKEMASRLCIVFELAVKRITRPVEFIVFRFCDRMGTPPPVDTTRPPRSATS